MHERFWLAQLGNYQEDERKTTQASVQGDHSIHATGGAYALNLHSTSFPGCMAQAPNPGWRFDGDGTAL